MSDTHSKESLQLSLTQNFHSYLSLESFFFQGTHIWGDLTRLQFLCYEIWEGVDTIIQESLCLNQKTELYPVVC